MKNSILFLGVIASAGISFLHLGTVSTTAISPPQKAVSSLTAWESRPDFNYTGTNEDGEQEEVKTGKGRR